MSYEVKKRGSSWRARVRIYGIPAKTATFDTHREAHDWAVIKNGELLAEKKSAEKLLVNSPVVPASIPSNSNNTLERLPAWPNSRIDELLPLKEVLP